jgi:hypothetical protein
MTASAKAVTYMDIDPVLKLLNDDYQSHTGDFNISEHGYNPSSQYVYSAKAWFFFSDDLLPLPADPLDKDGKYETVEVTLGLGHLDPSAHLGPIEVNLGTILGGNISGDVLVDLSEDGKLTYTVDRVKGDFWFLGAKLVADAGSRTAATLSDGGTTVGLLGLALLGLFVAYTYRRVRA